MHLHKLVRIKGNKRKAKRLGRGYSSGRGGHTTIRGAKGQKARGKVSQGFEGGQTPLYKRLPRFGGFRNPTKRHVASVSLFKFNGFKAGTTVTPKHLIEKGILKKIPFGGVKILKKGSLKKKLTFEGFIFSEGARKAVEKVDGTIKE